MPSFKPKTNKKIVIDKKNITEKNLLSFKKTRFLL